MKAFNVFIALFIPIFSVYASVTVIKSKNYHLIRDERVKEISSDIPDEIGTKEISKKEITPLFKSAKLGDIIVFSPPLVNYTNTIYFLSNPKGDSFKINVNKTRVTSDYKEASRFNNYDYYYNYKVAENDGEVKSIIAAKRIRRINEYQEYDLCSNNYFDEQPNDIRIGPLSEDDHGNWVISAFYERRDGGWVELFQVNTIEIIESVSTYAPKNQLVPGETFEPRFLYPINNLESCEIRPPRTTLDRFYDRDSQNMDTCGFRIPNVTTDDEGLWEIIGVGKLVYWGKIYLLIDNNEIGIKESSFSFNYSSR